MTTLTSLQQLATPVDMTGWPDPYASGDIPQPIAPIRPLSPLDPSTPTVGTPNTNASGIAAARGIDTSNPSLYSHSPTGGYFPELTAWIKAHVEDAVFVVIGLILIAAAVFSFKETRDAVVSTAKTAAEVAAVAA